MSDPNIEAMAEKLTDTFMNTVNNLATEHGLTTAEYLQARAYHARLSEYPFHLVVQAMRMCGMFGESAVETREVENG